MSRLDQFCQAEVDDLGTAHFRHQDVLRFQVAMRSARSGTRLLDVEIIPAWFTAEWSAPDAADWLVAWFAEPVIASAWIREGHPLAIAARWLTLEVEAPKWAQQAEAEGQPLEQLERQSARRCQCATRSVAGAA